jgi:hypothetical protein
MSTDTDAKSQTRIEPWPGNFVWSASSTTRPPASSRRRFVGTSTDVVADTARAEEHGGGTHAAQGLLGERADEGEVGAAQEPAQHDDVDDRIGAQLVEDGEAGRDHGDAPAPQLPGECAGRRADVEQKGVAVLDESCGVARDGPLLRRGVVGRLLVGPVDLDCREGSRAAMDPPDEAGIGQLGEVAANGRRRHAQSRDELLHRDRTVSHLVGDRAMSRVAHLATMAHE